MCATADGTSLDCARCQVEDVGGALCESVGSANRNDASCDGFPTISATETSTRYVAPIDARHDDCVRSLCVRCGFGVRQGARTGVQLAVPIRVCFEERQPQSSPRNSPRHLQPTRTRGVARSFRTAGGIGGTVDTFSKFAGCSVCELEVCFTRRQ